MTVERMVWMLGNGEFDDVDDGVIAEWIEFFRPMVSKKQFGKLYDQALALLVCHKLKLSGYGADSLGELGKIGNSFVASSVSDGGSSISYANSGPSNKETNAEFGMTLYGMQYLQLLKMCVVPINISRGVLMDAGI